MSERDGPWHAARAPEPSAPGDRFHDYILAPYAPLRSTEGRWRSLNLLIESFALAGVEAEGVAFVERLRERFGPWRTVWGIKHLRGHGVRSWELYFYDRDRAHHDVDPGHVTGLVADLVPVRPGAPPEVPFHMFSLEFDAAQLRAGASALDPDSGERVPPCALELYVGPSCHAWDGAGLVYKTHYSFHDPMAGIDEVVDRLNHCVHLRHEHTHSGVVWPPELRPSVHLCVAHKRTHDALYWSRVRAHQARFFLRWQGWPAELVRFFEAHEARFDHLYWDLGADFCADPNADGGVRFDKSGIYGTF